MALPCCFSSTQRCRHVWCTCSARGWVRCGQQRSVLAAISNQTAYNRGTTVLLSIATLKENDGRHFQHRSICLDDKSQTSREIHINPGLAFQKFANLSFLYKKQYTNKLEQVINVHTHLVVPRHLQGFTQRAMRSSSSYAKHTQQFLLKKR